MTDEDEWDDGGVPILRCDACLVLLEFDSDRGHFYCPECGLITI